MLPSVFILSPLIFKLWIVLTVLIAGTMSLVARSESPDTTTWLKGSAKLLGIIGVAFYLVCVGFNWVFASL